MTSEADLDSDIKALSVLSEHPELFTEFRKLGCLASLVSLLSHENTDIAIDAVEVISELTDDEVEAEPDQWNSLVDGMIEAQLLEMLTQNLSRLNETIETDRHGVYHTLSMCFLFINIYPPAKVLLFYSCASTNCNSRRLREPRLPAVPRRPHSNKHSHPPLASLPHPSA